MNEREKDTIDITETINEAKPSKKSKFQFPNVSLDAIAKAGFFIVATGLTAITTLIGVDLTIGDGLLQTVVGGLTGAGAGVALSVIAGATARALSSQDDINSKLFDDDERQI